MLGLDFSTWISDRRRKSKEIKCWEYRQCDIQILYQTGGQSFLIKFTVQKNQNTVPT